MNVEEDPILDVLSLSFIEGLVTAPHPQLFPKQGTFPLFTQILSLLSQVPFLSRLFPRKSTAIPVQEHLN